MKRKRLLSILAGAIGATAMSVPITAGATAGAATLTGYAALGDSYTSGPLIADQSLSPLGCLRSDHDYPHLAAAALGLTLTDISCSGATTADLTGSQATISGTNPPQLNAVNATDKVVTLGIGGDDIDFVGILENCAAATPFGPTEVGRTCESHYTAGGTDQISAAIQALAPKVAAALTDIHTLAPGADVFLVGYPAIFPPTGSGCWPQLPFTLTDLPYLRSKEVQLNSTLAQVAAANGATYVDTYTGSTGHNACTSESTRWVEPVVPDSLAAPVHPNAAGEAALAGFVESAVAAKGA